MLEMFPVMLEIKSSRPNINRTRQRPPFERIALLLQGGGTLGSYQAGVYEALAEANLHPDWVGGISIGAVNSALIAGNPREKRVAKLREFWEAVGSPALGILGVPYHPEVEIKDELTHRVVNQTRALGIIRSRRGCASFVRTNLVDKQIPEQAKERGISEQEVIDNVTLKDAVDHKFTTVEDVAETALFLASFNSNALTGQSIVVSQGVVHGAGKRLYETPRLAE